MLGDVGHPAYCDTSQSVGTRSTVVMLPESPGELDDKYTKTDCRAAQVSTHAHPSDTNRDACCQYQVLKY